MPVALLTCSDDALAAEGGLDPLAGFVDDVHVRGCDRGVAVVAVLGGPPEPDTHLADDGEPVTDEPRDRFGERLRPAGAERDFGSVARINRLTVVASDVGEAGDIGIG